MLTSCCMLQETVECLSSEAEATLESVLGHNTWAFVLGQFEEFALGIPVSPGRFLPAFSALTTPDRATPPGPFRR